MKRDRLRFGLESRIILDGWETELLKLLDARKKYLVLSVAPSEEPADKSAKLATVTATLASTSISPSTAGPSGTSHPVSPTKRKRKLPEETEETSDLSKKS